MAPTSGPSVRTRILATLLAFMACGLLLTGGVSTAVQLNGVDRRIDQEQAQALGVIRNIADTRAEEGRPFRTVDDLLRITAGSASAGEHRAELAFIDGAPRYRPRGSAFDLSSPGTIEQIRTAAKRRATVRTDLDVGGRTVRARIATVRVEGDRQVGVYVVADDLTAHHAAVWRWAGVYAVVSAVTMVLAGIVGAAVSGRLLRPLADLRRAAAEVTAQRLDRRVPVPPTRDDVAELAMTVNRMFGRLEEGFSAQQIFLRSVGHELRTPLTIIGGTLETSDPDDPDDVRSAHAVALDEVDRMAVLLDDLSVLASIRDPGFLRPRRMELGDLARSAIVKMHALGDRRWELETADEVAIVADPERLMQAVVQLAANAVRYSPPESRIVLDARCVPGAAPGAEEVRIAVTDHGAGVDPREREQIFEIFERGTAAEGTDGSGLGLAIVQTIAVAHGGRVDLESTVGQGSTFTIIIPFVRPSGRDGTGSREEGIAE